MAIRCRSRSARTPAGTVLYTTLSHVPIKILKLKSRQSFEARALILYFDRVLYQVPLTTVEGEPNAVRMSYLQENEAPRVIVVNIVTLVIAVIAVILRLISRRLSAAHFWWDDWLIIVGLFLDFGSSAFNFIGKLYIICNPDVALNGSD